MAKSKPKLTAWFPPNVKPVRTGVYIATVKRPTTFYRFWDGVNWHYGSYTDPEDAACRTKVWLGPPLHWRGLSEQPQ